MDDIGKRLRQTRRAQEQTLQGLAKRAGVSFQSIHRIEKGEQVPQVGTVAKLAGALGVDLKWLMFGDDEKGAER